jgi:hypothetical protein
MTGFEAFKALRDGKKVRRIMWTAGCYLQANIDTEENTVTIEPVGSTVFLMDIEAFGMFPLEQLLEDAEFDAWEVAE